MQGWISLHRELLTKPIWLLSTPEQKCILIAILLMANHEEKAWEWKGEKYICQPGQMITSLDKIAKKAGKGVSIQNVRTAITRFEKYGFLTNESTNSNRLITICNWNEYQTSEIEQKNENSSFVSPLLVACYPHVSNGNSTNELTKGATDISISNTEVCEDTETEANKETNKQPTSNQQAANKQLTTNNNDNNVNNNTLYIKGEKKIISDSLFKTLNSLLADQVYIEMLCINKSIPSIDEMKDYLKTFFVDLESRGEKYKDEADAKHHFSSWLTLQLEKQPQKEKGGNNGTTPRVAHNGANDKSSKETSKDYSTRF